MNPNGTTAPEGAGWVQGFWVKKISDEGHHNVYRTKDGTFLCQLQPGLLHLQLDNVKTLLVIGRQTGWDEREARFKQILEIR